MSIDISGIAYAIRTASAASAHPLKLSHAQQCVAAALGHKSLAALQASPDARQTLDEDCHLLLDTELLAQRARELDLSIPQDDLAELIERGLEEKVAASVHLTVDSLEMEVLDRLEDRVLNDDRVISQTTMVNSDGLEEVYLPLDVDWRGMPVDDEKNEVRVLGHVSMRIDDERPYWGHRVDVEARLWVTHLGTAIWATASKVLSAELYRGDGSENEPERVSLAQALAELLEVEYEDADLLAEAPLEELSSDDGLVYAYVFEFGELALEDALRENLQAKLGSLTLTVGADFLERVDDREDAPARHYVHGDQSETDPGLYYCKACDAFVAPDHFEARHPGQAQERYFASLGAWQRRPARNKMATRRPASAVNLLAESAQSEREAREASRSDFHRWLLQQMSRDDEVGDLARDAERDRTFPVAESARALIRAYLERRSRAREVLQAFERAWQEFAAVR